MKKTNFRFVTIILALLFVLEFFSVHAHSKGPWWHKVTGINLLWGLAASFFLMGTAKLLGRFWLERQSNYYKKEK